MPDDVTDLPWTSRGIYVGGAGTLTVLLANNADATEVTFTAIAVGTMHRLAVRRVLATGTTATLIVALA